ncbi:PQQ-binding-like beta-propeller repeat protein [Nocardiopsis tropica]|uniref:PQQ-binding-like beta-propeller repeat protein n=1 Tax=Nocardiopsis tropica TaxID=109330 RepID=A0ABU7KJC4_9ACTN|nr:PQQ-binding-like beta-propeller repeat protein [Nocardiopsis umidischolae]MEE2049378.1 PQQ-binding-like beta-propeller repeat protein [Nocardiopsis umidischolae]
MSRGVNTVSSGRRPFFASVAGPVLISFSLLACSCSFPGEAGGADEVSEPQAVTSVSGVGWEWQTPSEREILAVEPVAMGAAVFMDTGVAVLHGGTGEEVWSYLVPEQEAFAAGLTVDGASLLVARGPSSDEPPEETLMLDADSGDSTGEFRVREGFAPWDLWSASEAERVHRPPGVVEEYRPLSIIDVASGDQRWEQEAPLTCEADPGLASQQPDSLIHDSLLLVLVVCSPEQFENPLEVTTAVVALDLADGQEVWRQEFTHESVGTFPNASIAVEGNALLLEGRDLPEAHVINVPDGEIRASTPRTVVGMFEGEILAWEGSSEGHRYDLLGTDLETVESVEFPERPWRSLLSEEDVLPLGDGLVSVEVLEEDGAPSALALGFTPWGGTETEVLDSGFPIEAGDYFDRFTGQVVEVPGAVVLLDGRSPEPTQLVAYQ